MKIIQSRNNSEIKKICLLHKKKERDASQRFLAEGIRAIETIIQQNVMLEQLYITQEHDIPEWVPKDKVTIVSDHVMDKISSSTTPPGYIGIFHKPQSRSIASSGGLVLANITDPGNMGTLIRTAATFNTPQIIIIDGADPWSPKVIAASAGTITAVPLIQCSWHEMIKKEKRATLCALTVKGGEQPQKVDLADNLLVVGNEAHGLPAVWRNQCEKKCTIQMPGKTESLNAAVAGSIALYCAYLQKNG